MKHTEKHETNRNSQLTPATSPRSTWPMMGGRGASGASTFHSRARIYKDFHPVNTFRAVNIPSLQVNCSIIADKNAESGEKKRENAFEFA